MKIQHKLLGALRILMGTIFLWAFFDKLFGLGFATEAGKAWVRGGSPTAGFLQFGVRGPFADMFHALAGNVFVDWLFMTGLLCIGTALILGIGMRIAVWSGSLMLALMWLAVLPPEHHPVVDDHIMYIVVLFVLLHTEAGWHLGLGGWWARNPLVKRWGIFQ